MPKLPDLVIYNGVERFAVASLFTLMNGFRDGVDNLVSGKIDSGRRFPVGCSEASVD
ncbi:MAG: hypothetical protein HC839_06145 [Leptolyngbyaceae cyanobacterium RM2_2_21]|nr:hypothetical protein [Leptolyngbyaceae cyanobacterium RM2_2_21]